jgi:large subunit ribosomal protein L25
VKTRRFGFVMASDNKTYSLAVEPREITGKASRKLLRENLVPAVIYGHNVQPRSVQVPRREFEQVYLRSGSTHLVDLSVGQDGAQKVFIHDVQRNSTNYAPIHIDFLVVNLREEITMNIQVILTGEAPAVARGDGMLLQQLDHLSIKALPTSIPSSFEVDISSLEEVDQGIHVSEVEVPEGVTLLTPTDELIVKVAAMPVLAVEEEEAEEGAEEAAAEAEAEGGEEEGGKAPEAETE